MALLFEKIGDMARAKAFMKRAVDSYTLGFGDKHAQVMNAKTQLRRIRML
jgi:hypothetical protein